MGPGAGGEGGRIVATGTPAQVAKVADAVSRTAPYLRQWMNDGRGTPRPGNARKEHRK